MQINVMQSSGDVDSWFNVADALNDDGMLMVISRLPTEDPTEAAWNLENMKIITLAKEVDQGPDRPPLELREPYLVEAVYAPGMWMKVEFSA